jgi:hypothetical protein
VIKSALYGFSFGLGFSVACLLAICLYKGEPLRIHISSVGKVVEQGIAAQREVLRKLGVDMQDGS